MPVSTQRLPQLVESGVALKKISRTRLKNDLHKCATYGPTRPESGRSSWRLLQAPCPLIRCNTLSACPVHGHGRKVRAGLALVMGVGAMAAVFDPSFTLLLEPLTF